MIPGLDQLQRHWAPLAQAAAWLAGLIGAFLVEPPLVWPRAPDTGMWLNLSQFLVAIMIGLFFLGSGPAGRRRNRWRIFAAVAAMTGFALFIVYQILLNSWICFRVGDTYVGYPVIVGANGSLLQLGRDLVATNPGATCDYVIGGALGVTTDLWPAGELITRYVILCGVYTFAMLAFSAAAMSTIAYLRNAPQKTAEAGEP